MKGLYQSPLRVYLCLFCLAAWGIISGLQLPISLFPNSSKPRITVQLQYGGLTSDEFLQSYGRGLERRLKAASFDGHDPERVEANYDSTSARFTVEYHWGAPGREAQREVESAANSYASSFPQEIRDSIGVWGANRNTGFLAISYYSSQRSMDDLYKLLEPMLTPRLAKVTEADRAGLWNPSEKEIRIELNAEKMALLQLVPADIELALRPALQAHGGGGVQVGLNHLDVTMNRQAQTIEDLARLPLTTAAGTAVHLGDIAKVDLDTRSDHVQIMKTSGMSSLILFANPRAGGNIKKMAEDIIQIVCELQTELPADVKYKILVDPSEFIRSAVKNVMHEVWLAAGLAVLVLFLFIGNVRNVMTAAVEIPLSIILAFILMKLFDINLNLISLGGLALSAGMNVDASVVVMENIFRHFEEHKGHIGPKERLRIVLEAVSEVRFPVIASTVASLVVFLPLAAMQAGLTNAILGDLALAVVFSHGLSAFVALVLVPTVRLQLMAKFGAEKMQGKSPIESWLRKAENLYARGLGLMLAKRRLRLGAYGAVVATLVLLLTLVLPMLPKEVVGMPDTDWLDINVQSEGNSHIRQMEGQVSEIEARLLQKFGDRVQYTFTQIYDTNGAEISARLKDKSNMMDLWKEMETEFASTPFIRFHIQPWNPSELRLPDPPHLQLSARGTDVGARINAAREVRDLLQEKKIYPHVSVEPGVDRRENVFLQPDPERWSVLQAAGLRLRPSDLADLSRVATSGRQVGFLPIDGKPTSLVMRFPKDRVRSVEDLASLPVGLGGRLLPLKGLATVQTGTAPPTVYREDGKELVLVEARLKKQDESQYESAMAEAEKVVQEWQKSPKAAAAGASIVIEDPRKELNEALYQLGIAVALSVLLIFVTMVFQFGDVACALLVLVSVPLGFIGVLVSLFVFQSTLSLNSVLGVILLNGISVANSIILVDFLKRLVESGRAPVEAALEAAQKRLRPILMTSLTTGLGMLPIALGMGEGGRILQPLGIAVIGGLGFSMATTLFLVPTLQVSYLEWRGRRRALHAQTELRETMA